MSPSLLDQERGRLLTRLRLNRYELLNVAVLRLFSGGLLSDGVPWTAIAALLFSAAFALSIASALFAGNITELFSQAAVLGWISLMALSSSVCASTFASRLFETLREDVVPQLARAHDLAELARFLRKTFRMRSQLLFAAIFTLLVSSLGSLWVSQTKSTIHLSVGTLRCALVASSLVGSSGWYLLGAMLLVPQVLKNMELPMFDVEPAQSRVIVSLSSLFQLGVMLAAINAAVFCGGLFLFKLLQPDRSQLIAVVVSLWAPFLAVFGYHQLTLAAFIGRSKRARLGRLQSEIQQTEAWDQERAKALLLAHERLLASADVAIDWKQMVTLVNSLVLPIVVPLATVLWKH